MRELKKELWPYKVKIKKLQDAVDITTMEIWLGEMLGTFKGKWTIVYRHDGTDFYFRDERDANLFALRWV